MRLLLLAALSAVVVSSVLADGDHHHHDHNDHKHHGHHPPQPNQNQRRAPVVVKKQKSLKDLAFPDKAVAVIRRDGKKFHKNVKSAFLNFRNRVKSGRPLAQAKSGLDNIVEKAAKPITKVTDKVKEKQILALPRPVVPTFQRPVVPVVPAVPRPTFQRPNLPAINLQNGRNRFRTLMSNFRNNIRNVVPAARPPVPAGARPVALATPALPTIRRPTFPTLNFRNPFRSLRALPNNRRRSQLPAIAFQRPETIPGYEKFTLAEAVLPVASEKSDDVSEVEYIEPRNAAAETKTNPFLSEDQVKKVASLTSSSSESEKKPTDFELR